MLRAISESQTDAQPVFDAIAGAPSGSAGPCAVIIHITADYNLRPEAERYFRHAFPAPPTSEGMVSVAIRERRIVQPRCQPGSEHGTLGYQAVIAVPMRREDTVTGAIGLSRPEPHAFSDQQVELLKTFADQAVIAFENVRLFKDLGASNTGLIEALERQTATGEILRVISSSPNDVQPVFAAIAQNRAALWCKTKRGLSAAW